MLPALPLRTTSTRPTSLSSTASRRNRHCPPDTEVSMHRMRSALRDDLHGGGLLLAKQPTYHGNAHSAASAAHFASTSLAGAYSTDITNSKPCSVSQFQFHQGEGMSAALDHDVLARAASFDMRCVFSGDVSNLPPCSALSSPVGGVGSLAANGVDGSVLNQLLLSGSSSGSATRTSSSGSSNLVSACSPHCSSPQQQQLLTDRADWQLGRDFSPHSQQQLLAQAQQQQQQLLFDDLHLTSQPQAAAGSPHQQQHAMFGPAVSGEQEWLEQLLGAAAAAAPDSTGNLYRRCAGSPRQPAVASNSRPLQQCQHDEELTPRPAAAAAAAGRLPPARSQHAGRCRIQLQLLSCSSSCRHNSNSSKHSS